VDPNQLVVRIWEIGTGQERRLTMPRDHEEAIGEVLVSEDLAYVAVRVVNRRDAFFRVILLESATGRVSGSWECSNAPLIFLGSDRFGFIVRRGENGHQFVELQANGVTPRLVPDPDLVFDLSQADYEPRFRGTRFTEFSTRHAAGPQSALFLWYRPNAAKWMTWLEDRIGQLPWLHPAAVGCRLDIERGELTGWVKLDHTPGYVWRHAFCTRGVVQFQGER
jgi:hypothetical protein